MNPDNGAQEATLIAAEYPPLTADELRQTISNKTIYGDFGAFFKAVTTITADGHMEGRNNAGAHVFGHCVVNNDGTLTLKWDSGWIDATLRAYHVDGQIKFFDVTSGAWRTTFTHVEDGLQSPLVAPVMAPA